MTEPCRCCGWGVVVRLHKVLKDVDISPRLVFREVTPHARLQRSIESFDDSRLRLRVVSGEVMDAVLLQQSLNDFIQKFESLICLKRLWPAFGERSFQRRHQRRRGLVLQQNSPSHFRGDVDHLEVKGHTVVVIFQIRQDDEIGLPLLKWTSHDDASSPEMTFRRFVYGIGVLFRQPFFDDFVRHARDASQGVDSAVTRHPFQIQVDPLQLFILRRN